MTLFVEIADGHMIVLIVTHQRLKSREAEYDVMAEHRGRMKWSQAGRDQIDEWGALKSNLHLSVS